MQDGFGQLFASEKVIYITVFVAVSALIGLATMFSTGGLSDATGSGTDYSDYDSDDGLNLFGEDD